MGIIDKKERVLEIILTQHGRDLLSKGKFIPKYYAFADDEVDYQTPHISQTASFEPSVFLFDYNFLNYFSRSSEAAAVDNRASSWSFFNLTTPWYSVNIPRITSDGYLMIEGQRTNLILSSSQFDNSVWGFPTNGHMVTGSQTDPLGTSTAQRVISKPSTREGAAQVVAGDVPNIRIGSMYAAQGSGVGLVHTYQIRPGVQPLSASGIAFSSAVAFSRIVFQLPNSASRLYVQDGRGSATLIGNAGIGAADLDAVIWNAQLEDGQFVTSPIRAFTASVSGTRTAEVAEAATNFNFLTKDWSVQLVPEFSSSFAPSLCYGFYINGNNNFQIISGTTARLVANGFSYNLNSLTYSANSVITFNIKMSSGLFSTGTNSVPVTSSWFEAGKTVYIGSNGTGSHFYGLIGRPLLL